MTGDILLLFNAVMLEKIKNRIKMINDRIAEACHRVGRNPDEVRVVAVTKTVRIDTILTGLEAGLTLLGENYIQEAQAKIEAVGAKAQWHFIGGLQTKKAKYAVRLFDLIHSVDNLKLAGELDKRAGMAGLRQAVLVQINVSGESTKGGVGTSEAEELIHSVSELPHLELRGLMTMPPFFDQPDRARPYFTELRRLRDGLALPLPELSMGMSGDFEVAVEEGATLVRIGTAIFGERN